MAGLQTRGQRIKTIGLEKQLEGLMQSIKGLEAENTQLKGENQALRQIINRLEDTNTTLMTDNRRLQKQLDDKDIIELVPFSDDSRPTTADTGGYEESKDGNEPIPPPPSPLMPEQETIVDEIISSVRNTLLETTIVSERAKDFIRSNGDVLVVYFQLTKNANDIYGYSILDSGVLNDRFLLNEVDNRDNIHLFIHRSGAQRDDMKTAKTVSVVVHNSGWVESPMEKVSPGDILLWIRTNDSINTIKSNLGYVFKTKFLGTLRLQCGRGAICDKTKENVEFVSEIISGAYQDIRPEPVKPTALPTALPAPAPPPASKFTASFDKYADMVRVPELFNNPQYILYDLYWASGEVPDFLIIDWNADNGPLRDLTNATAMSNANAMAAVSKQERLYYGTAMKNVARYIMSCVDYFHQLLDVYFDSQVVIDNNREFFYGHDIGRHKTLVGPSPPLKDLMDHMFDIRQGFTYIDELCSIISIPLRQVDTTNERLRNFISLVDAGAKRFSNKNNPTVDYDAYKRFNYIYRVKKELTSLAPPPPSNVVDNRKAEGAKVLPEQFFSSDELSRLYSGIGTTLSLGNYYDAAVTMGLGKEFSYLEPDIGHARPTLSNSLEKLTGQLSLGEPGLYLPWIIDGMQIRRPQFEFVSAWRNIIYYQFQNSMDDYLYKLSQEKELGKLAPLSVFKLTYSDTIQKDAILNKLMSGIHQPLRSELRDVASQVMELVCITLDGRYKMYKESTPTRLLPRETAVAQSEYYTYMNVFNVIKMKTPDWDSDAYRKANIMSWLEIPGAFVHGGGAYADIEVQSLDMFEWMCLSRIERFLEEETWRNAGSDEDEYY